MSTQLTESIRRAIASGGPVTFRSFMEQALYHPEHGYYASGKARIGKGGDFFTSVSVGPLFGALLSTQFAAMWRQMGMPAPFFIVEQGANDGLFARDVLETLRRNEPAFYEELKYRIVEPFEAVRGKQVENLRPFASKVSWCASLEELAPFSGIHFSNELLDAMPVHLLVYRNEGWRERRVDWQGDAFVFVEANIEDEGLSRHAMEIKGAFREGFRLEVNLDVDGWIHILAAKLARGYVLTIDYGDARASMRGAAAGRGTLSCFRAHRRTENPLLAVGEQDLTARVDFTQVARAAAGAHFKVEGFTDQHHFITALAVHGFEKLCPGRDNSRNVFAFNQLSHPDLMGTHFKVLCLSKEVAAVCPPAGFALGGDFAPAL